MLRRAIFVLLFLLPRTAYGQTVDKSTAGAPVTSERRGELQLKAARSNPPALYHFLLTMPKGADLHSHLSGAV